MKVQLVKAPLTEDLVNVDKWYMPLDLISLANAVNDISDIEILDGTHLTKSEILERLNADLTGISFTTLSISNVLDIAKVAKSNGSFVIFGGQAATARPEVLFQLPETDAVVVYDGEAALRGLIEYRFQRLDKIPNLVFRRNGSLEKTAIEKPNLDSYYSVLDRSVGGLRLEDYIEYFKGTNTLLNIDAERPTNIFSQRGCMRRCSFCARQDNEYRTRNSKNVEREIRQLRDDYSIDYVIDVSDTWANTDWVNAFSEAYNSQSGMGMMVFADIRDMTEEKTKIMKECGIDNILYGIESGSEEILRKNRKSYTKKEVLKAVRQTRENDIGVSASFVIGLLGETKRSLQETEALTDELRNIEGVRPYVNMIIPLPGSMLWEQFMEHPKMRSKYSRDCLDYNLDQTRKDFLGTCTDVTLEELTELRDKKNQFSE